MSTLGNCSTDTLGVCAGRSGGKSDDQLCFWGGVHGLIGWGHLETGELASNNQVVVVISDRRGLLVGWGWAEAASGRPLAVKNAPITCRGFAHMFVH